MRFSAAMLACALALPSIASAAQIDLRTGGWEIQNSLPNGQVGAPQKQCLSAEDLQNMRMFLPPESESECTLQGENQTKTTLELKETCNGAHPSTLTISIKADNPKKFVATLTATANGAVQTIQMSARWLQDSCEGFSN
jgi:hypothetical protein